MNLKYINKPKFLLENYVELGLTDKQLIIILLCMTDEETIKLDYKKIKEHLNLEMTEVTKILSSLFQDNLVTPLLVNNDNNEYEEHIDIKNLFNLNNSSSETNVFNELENIYGKTFSSSEVNIISKWISEHIYTYDEIINAFGIAALNNVTNINYVEKILLNSKDEVIEPLAMKYDWLNND